MRKLRPIRIIGIWKPSSYRVFAFALKPPGVGEPLSPWCPPQLTHATSSPFQNTGIAVNMSYGCTPPPSSSLKKKMSPSASPTLGSGR